MTVYFLIAYYLRRVAGPTPHLERTHYAHILELSQKCHHVLSRIHHRTGGDLRGDWRDGPPKFEVGGRPMHSSPQYLGK